jgi:hypothetical protein
MAPHRNRILGLTVALSMTLQAHGVFAGGPNPSLPTLPARIPSTRPMAVQSPMRAPAIMQAPTAPGRGSAYAFAAQNNPEVRPAEEPAPAVEPGQNCNGAPCTPYFRNRANCPGVQADRIHMYNRQHEPNWYRYYRCCQFGYHPTQWQAWPEGWLTCRHPQPGEHPYDYHPPRPDQKQLERERRLIRENDRALDRDEPERLDDPNRNPDATAPDAPRRDDTVPPRLVPPTNSTTPPAPTGPAPVDPLPSPPSANPSPTPPVDPLPMPMPMPY